MVSCAVSGCQSSDWTPGTIVLPTNAPLELYSRSRILTEPPSTVVSTNAVALYVPATECSTQFGLSFSVHVGVPVPALDRSAAQPPLCPAATRLNGQLASVAQPVRFVSNVEFVTRLPAAPMNSWVAAVDVSP